MPLMLWSVTRELVLTCQSQQVKLYAGETLPSEVFLPVRTALFEGMEVFVPGDAEKYLTNLYGKNYMQLPPVEKRERHFIIDFDLNCSE